MAPRRSRVSEPFRTSLFGVQVRLRIGAITLYIPLRRSTSSQEQAKVVSYYSFRAEGEAPHVRGFRTVFDM